MPMPEIQSRPVVTSGMAEEVERAVLERGLVVDQLVPAALHAGPHDRAAGEPGAAQLGQRVPPGQQGADPGRVAEQLVPAHRHELGLDRAEVEPVVGTNAAASSSTS